MQQLSKEQIERLPYFEIIAYLGAASIHPRGFSATRQMLKMLDMTKDMKILDIGCGTGYTACYIAKTYGCKVVGIDSSVLMVERAKDRANRFSVDCDFRVADAHELPFDGEEFDLIIGESITIYLDKPKALSEYLRVLKKGGKLADMEFTWMKEPDEMLLSRTDDVLDTRTGILDKKGWREAYLNSGFSSLDMHNFPVNMNLTYKIKKVFDQGFDGIKVLYNVSKYPHIKKKMGEISSLFGGHKEHFGYGIYIATK